MKMNTFKFVICLFDKMPDPISLECVVKGRRYHIDHMYLGREFVFYN